MSEALVIVLARGAEKAREGTIAAAARQTCALPFEIRSVVIGNDPGAAINAAIEASNAGYVALLDEGAPPEEGWLQALLGPLSEDARVGLVAGALYAAHPLACEWQARAMSEAPLLFFTCLGMLLVVWAWPAGDRATKGDGSPAPARPDPDAPARSSPLPFRPDASRVVAGRCPSPLPFARFRILGA